MTASTESVALLVENVNHRAGFFQLLLACLVAAADFFAVAQLLKPFKRLSQQLGLVAEGNLDQEIEVNDYLETRDISGSVRETIRRLKDVDQSR